MNVLLVDDSNSIAMVVGQMLNDAGFQHERAKDGKEAIEIINKGIKFDAILLDWNMPEMDCLEFLKYNKENNLISCPIVMMTTENKPEKIIMAMENGAAEYIMKPFTPDILLSKLESVLNA